MRRPPVPQVQRSPDKARFVAQYERDGPAAASRTGLRPSLCFFYAASGAPTSLHPSPEGHVLQLIVCWSFPKSPFLEHTVLSWTQTWSDAVPIGFGTTPPLRTANHCGGQKNNIGWNHKLRTSSRCIILVERFCPGVFEPCWFAFQLHWQLGCPPLVLLRCRVATMLRLLITLLLRFVSRVI